VVAVPKSCSDEDRSSAAGGRRTRVTAAASRAQSSSSAAATEGDDNEEAAVMPRRLALLAAAALPAAMTMVVSAPALAIAPPDFTQPRIPPPTIPLVEDAPAAAAAAAAAAEPAAAASAPTDVAAVKEDAEEGSAANAAEDAEAAMDAKERDAKLEDVKEGGAFHRAGAAEDVVMVGDVKLLRYRDDNSGWSIRYPEQWARDQPKANTPEFHPVSEYGGRRFRVEVFPVGRVSGGSREMSALADSELPQIVEAGYESAQSYANVEATKFAPVMDAALVKPQAKGVPGGAVSEIIRAEASPDGRYYYYEYRVESIYPLRFWGVSALGPGQQGGAVQVEFS
jgi:hypothetical protein